MSFEVQTGSRSTGSSNDPGMQDLVALYLRVADTLERSAELAERHAQRQPAAVEVQRAKRARIAAERGRALATELWSDAPLTR
jgi:hypothetical protein